MRENDRLLTDEELEDLRKTCASGEIRAEKEKVPALTAYVVFSILSVLVYTVVEQVLSTTTGISHDTLTTCFYACFGGEILCCALIKIFKLREGR